MDHSCEKDLYLNLDLKITMKLNSLATVLAIFASFPAAPSAKAIEERSPTGPFSLIAYGIASSYIKIFYSDGRTSTRASWYLLNTSDFCIGLAFAGDSSLWTYGKVTTDVTCMIWCPEHLGATLKRHHALLLGFHSGNADSL